MPHPRFQHPRIRHGKRRNRSFFVGFLFTFTLMIIFIIGTGTVLSFIINAVSQTRYLGTMHGSMMQPDYGRIFGLGFLAILFPLIAFRLALRTKRQFTNPIEEIIQASETVANGDLSVRVQEAGGNDLRHLMKTFNHMVEQLENVDEQRRNLTADVAHELRTPLHILQGNLEAVLDGVYEADEETLNGMLDETHTLTRLVDDLQTLSLAEAGQLHLQNENIDIQDVLNDIVTSFSGIAEKNKVKLSASAQDQPQVLGDIGRLEQVLSNLVSNALRYTPVNGTIELSARMIQSVVEILVVDSGSGIPVEDIPHIFNRFYRADKSRNREKGGAGLGLAIAKQLVEIQGGKISVESEAEKGTIFTITLPTDFSVPISKKG